MEFRLGRLIGKILFSAGMAWLILEQSHFRTEIIERYIHSDIGVSFSCIIVFLVFYLMASGYGKGMDKGGILIIPLFYAIVFCSVGAWLSLVVLVTFVSIRQGEVSGAAYWLVGIIAAILGAALLLYYPVRDVIRGINFFKN